MVMSNEADILVVGYNQERFDKEIRTKFRHWQVYACSAPFALHGRQFRYAFFTDAATEHKNWGQVYEILYARAESIRPLRAWRPDLDSIEVDDILVQAIRRSRYPAQ